MQEIERRAFERPVTLRAAPEGSASLGVLEGYAIVWESLSRDLGGWFEVIDRASVGEPGEGGVLDLGRHVRVIARTNHDSNLLLGTTDAGTLRIYVDDTGLRYEVDIPNTSHGRDVKVLAERGDLRFSSFAFRTPPGGREWEYDRDDRLVSRVNSLTLVDVAPVADPAYWDSSTALHRNFDLAAIRASLRPDTTPEKVDAPNLRAVAIGRARSIQLTLERGNA